MYLYLFQYSKISKNTFSPKYSFPPLIKLTDIFSLLLIYLCFLRNDFVYLFHLCDFFLS
jgi:hypothetical protein